MAKPNAAFHAGDTLRDPVIRRIGIADLKTALAQGFDDFQAMPTHVVFISLIYPILGLVLASFTFGYELVPLLFPLISGFALVGPFAALGLYELSRRREQGLDTSWRYAVDALRSPAIGAVIMVGCLLLVIFVAWLFAAQALYGALFGRMPPASIGGFFGEVLTTQRGWGLILLGNGIGLLFAIAALAVSVVAFPLLLDRHVGPGIAVRTSLRAVLANPGTMALWGMTVAVILALGSVPLFVGLAVAMPVLGHATWHLYRAVVEP